MDDKETDQSIIITQESIVPGSIKQRHLVPSPTQVGDLYYGRDGNSFGRIGVGTTGQVLTVSGGEPAWQSLPAPPSSPLTTKGDIYTYSTQDARLPVGSNNTILIADSSQTTGQRWGQLPNCSVTRTSAQTISNNSTTSVNFTTENFDTDNMHDNSTNNTRITAVTAGKYIIGATFQFDDNGSGARLAQIRKNGTTQICQATQQSGVRSRFSMSILDNASANDYYELRVFQDSGGNLDLSLTFLPVFWAYMIAG